MPKQMDEIVTSDMTQKSQIISMFGFDSRRNLAI